MLAQIHPRMPVMQQTGPLRQVKLRGLHKVDWLFVVCCAAHNFCRLPRLIAQSASYAPQELHLNAVAAQRRPP